MTEPAADSSTTTIVELVFPENQNHHGTLFGGACLSLMDKAAFVAASRYARAPIVLAGCDGIEFVAPVHSGQLIEATAYIAATGRSSMTIAVDVTAETLTTGERTLAVRGRFTMVAVSASGKPTKLTESQRIA